MIKGDGIGPEIADSVIKILNASGIKINWDEQIAGQKAIDLKGKVLTDELLNSIKKNKIALKAPITTPIGKGFKSANVQLRQHFNLFANVRPSYNLPNIKTPFNNVNLVIIRENTQDIYAGIEEKIDENTIHGIKLITKDACKNICNFAFEYALKNKRKEVGV
ncbi:NAD-dependent isocitrate dehydrogenase, partial [bacterium]|nr:NAD-dependent isocitrate dehydrogenase [bacterium]